MRDVHTTWKNKINSYDKAQKWKHMMAVKKVEAQNRVKTIKLEIVKVEGEIDQTERDYY